jgi:hypothetical protein
MATNSVTKIGNNEIPTYLLIGVGVFGIFAINKVINKTSDVVNKTGSTIKNAGTSLAEKVGLKESETNKQNTKRGMSVYFNPKFWKSKQYPKGTLLLNYATRTKLAKDLYYLTYDFHVFSILSFYDKIMAIFKQLPSKVAISQLADSYYTYCGKDLATAMQTTLTENEYNTLLNYLDTLK